ncbi:unnamed protein product [Blumeria hordei]|uniref:Uncharacterized protein n=1 Tax=Blumeria hordei TaxID=2867405 RepID=A0A383V0T2_BLUHO|nr:unnamed protein product [Blumeria hordei]
MTDLFEAVSLNQLANRRAGEVLLTRSPELEASSHIKGPREVMRERTAREARRKIEDDQKENLERVRAAEEARLIEERRQSIERRNSNATASGHQRRTSGRSAHAQARPIDKSQTAQESLPAQNTREPQPNNVDETGTTRAHSRQTEGHHRPGLSDIYRRSSPSHIEASSQPQPQNAVTRSTFPHAFERWETLSAHWEGLTSFWIRRLEENSNEIHRDPLLQQLSRQVTDLSAAGANLFHAVVELQRLRASSERKFQRWFNDTRSELERNKEVQATTERKLHYEVQARAAAVAEAAAIEKEKLNSDRLLAEARRELQISKEEARRAWEELGRREQEERARSISLRDGLPTVVGGVQVVPMMATAPSRMGNNRDTQYTSEPPNTSHISECSNEDMHHQHYTRMSDDTYNLPSETSTRSRPTNAGTMGSETQPHITYTSSYSPSQILADQPASMNFYKQNVGNPPHPGKDVTYLSNRDSEANFSDEYDEEYELHDQGRFDCGEPKPKVNQQDTNNDSSNTNLVDQNNSESGNPEHYSQIPGVEYGHGPTTQSDSLLVPGSNLSTNAQVGDTYDLAGLAAQCYHIASEWPGVSRHHHPTRLSDVMEEDERSRTSRNSVSQISRSRDER